MPNGKLHIAPHVNNCDGPVCLSYVTYWTRSFMAAEEQRILYYIETLLFLIVYLQFELKFDKDSFDPLYRGSQRAFLLQSLKLELHSHAFFV